MYVIEMVVHDRWIRLGGRFTTKREADLKAVEYMGSGAYKRPKILRVVRL